MDLFDIFSGQESWHTRRLLDLAKTLSDEQLDRPLPNQVTVCPFEPVSANGPPMLELAGASASRKVTKAAAASAARPTAKMISGKRSRRSAAGRLGFADV